MKLITLFLVAGLLQVSAATFGQRLTLQERNITYEQIFREIRKQTGYRILMDNTHVNTQQRIDVRFNDAPLEEVLAYLTADHDLVYQIDRKYIVIKPEKAKAPSVDDRAVGPALILAYAEVRGRVVDSLGQPLSGASVRVINAAGQRTTLQTSTDPNGEFLLTNVPEDASLEISYVGYVRQKVKVAADIGVIVLKIESSQLEGVEVVVNTGYQQIPKERATGSFVFLDSALLVRRVSTNIVDRLEGVTSGLIFNSNVQVGENESPFSIRGRSTLFANTRPLIIIDNFPYEGDISNLNPADVASITVLKDAAAASIWGARSGNGVVVITTKSGRRNTTPKVSFTTNLSFGARPKLDYHPMMDNADYIAVERLLFDQGYYNARIDAKPRGILSPAVEVFLKEREGGITAAEARSELEILAGHRLLDDLERYFYQPSLNQQYSLNISGGGASSTYYIAAGYDGNRSDQTRNNYQRYTTSARHSAFFVDDRLEIQIQLNLTQSINRDNNPGGPNPSYPYARLADSQGHALPIEGRSFHQAYLDTVGEGLLLDWRYRPLDELNHADKRNVLGDYRIGTDVSFRIISPLRARVAYQFNTGHFEERNLESLDLFNTRDLINLFTQINYANKTVTGYPVPMGAILRQRNGRNHNHNLRALLDYDHTIGQHHQLAALAGWELIAGRSTVSTGTLYGYDERNATNVPIDYVNTYPARPYGLGRLLAPNNVFDSYAVNRYLSVFGNFSYTFKRKYMVTGSIRKDESNLFGVDADQRGVPLWSGGLAWQLDRESFFHADWVRSLRLRATYGYNGNVDRSISAYTTARSTSTNRYGALQFEIVNPPNPQLRWEAIGVVNLGLDFSLWNHRLNGSVEYFQKNGRDLIGFAPKPASSGVSLFRGNNANIRTTGVDVVLNSVNLDRELKWTSGFLFSYVEDRVTKFLAKPGTLATFVANTFTYPYEGKPYNSIFALRWAGLDPTNGNPMGYVNGAASSDYGRLRGIEEEDELLYMGTGRPRFFGALRNDFSYQGVSLSVNLTYKLGYVFRRQGVNYSSLVSLFGGSAIQPGFERRWQQPGDELITDVPSFNYPSDLNRDLFYRDSEHLIENGAHIRLKDVRLGYDLKRILPKGVFSAMQIYAYATNLGIVWKATGSYVDPDYPNAAGSLFLSPRTLSVGTVINF